MELASDGVFKGEELTRWFDVFKLRCVDVGVDLKKAAPFPDLSRYADGAFMTIEEALHQATRLQIRFDALSRTLDGYISGMGGHHQGKVYTSFMNKARKDRDAAIIPVQNLRDKIQHASNLDIAQLEIAAVARVVEEAEESVKKAPTWEG